MVAELTAHTDWRRPDCGYDCTLRRVIVPGLLGYQLLEMHAPDVHYESGRADAVGAAVPMLESGPLTFSRRDMRIWVDGAEVALTPTEWRVFLAIVDGGGALVTPQAILTRAWGAAYAEDLHVLRVHLARLRARLGAAAGLIETTQGMGYRFRFLPPGEMTAAPAVIYASKRAARSRRQA